MEISWYIKNIYLLILFFKKNHLIEEIEIKEIEYDWIISYDWSTLEIKKKEDNIPCYINHWYLVLIDIKKMEEEEHNFK